MEGAIFIAMTYFEGKCEVCGKRMPLMSGICDDCYYERLKIRQEENTEPPCPVAQEIKKASRFSVLVKKLIPGLFRIINAGKEKVGSE